MEGQKYQHPAIRRASWNPEVAENVAGKLMPKPRKGKTMIIKPLKMFGHLCNIQGINLIIRKAFLFYTRNIFVLCLWPKNPGF